MSAIAISSFETISIEDLSIVSGGQQAGPPAPAQSTVPRPVQDALKIGGTAVDVVRGTEPVRPMIDRGLQGWDKGYSLPASNGFERVINGIGGAAIEAFNLGW